MCAHPHSPLVDPVQENAAHANSGMVACAREPSHDLQLSKRVIHSHAMRSPLQLPHVFHGDRIHVLPAGPDHAHGPQWMRRAIDAMGAICA